MGSELLQFAGLIAAFAVVAVLWLFIVFLPARTMERWEGQRPGRRESGGRGGPDARPGEEPDAPDRP